MNAAKPLSVSEKKWLLKSLTDEASREGDLSHILHESQLEVLALLSATKGRFVLEKGRRWGGTFFLLTLAFMTCLRKPGCRVVYGAPTLKHLTEFVLPAFTKISALLPEDIRPKYNSVNSHITFPNAAWVHLFGCDDQRQADTGVGSDAELAIFDECGAKGMASLLKYVITSIFRPSLMTTGGRVVLGSSPARMPEHEFTIMCEQAEATGCYANRTIYDNPRLTDAQRDAFIQEDATDEGLSLEDYKKTDTFRREYMAERVIDKLLVCVPEWNDARTTQLVAVQRPEYFDGLVVLDYGGYDPHCATFGYYHFPLASYVIEYEVMLRDGENTKLMVDALKAKEREAWGTDRWEGTLKAFEDPQLMQALPAWLQGAEAGDVAQPRWRWCDNDIELSRDLHQLHGYSVIPTSKDTLESMTNRTRVFVNSKKLFVHPRCVHTDRDLRSTTWLNHKRQDFARRGGGHGDGLACINYGVRNLDQQRNPSPPGYGQQPGYRYPRSETKTLAERTAEALRRG